MRIQNLQVSRKHRHLILGNQELYASSRMLEKLASVFGEVGRVGITEIRDGRGNNPHTAFLSHFQWREDFTQSKPLGAVSTNWNAPELAKYAIPRMNNTLLLHGHTHAYDPLEFGRHHNDDQRRIGRMVFRAGQRSRIGGQLATHCVKRN